MHKICLPFRISFPSPVKLRSVWEHITSRHSPADKRIFGNFELKVTFFSIHFVETSKRIQVFVIIA